MERTEVMVDGERFEALACGPVDGTLALCLHGFPDVPATWAPVMERLSAAGFRCVAPYLRGYAPSTLAGPFDVDRLGSDVVAMAAALSPDAPAHVLGHDWGAVATYAALVAAPERFASAVTVSVPHPAQFVRNLARQPLQLGRSWYMAFFQLPVVPERAIRRGLVERLWRAWSPGYEPAPEHLREVARAIEDGGMASVEYYRALPRTLARAARWPAIRVPTLHVHGLDDGCVGAAVCRDQSRFFTGGHRTELVCGGHFAPLEEPDRVAELAIRFFASRRGLKVA